MGTRMRRLEVTVVTFRKRSRIAVQEPTGRSFLINV